MANLKNTETENVENNESNAVAPTALTLVPRVKDIAKRDIKYITCLPGTKKYESADADSRNYGKSFKTFLFIDAKGERFAFNVNADEPFCEDFIKRNINTLRLVQVERDDELIDGFYNLAGYETFEEFQRDTLFEQSREMHQAKLTFVLGAKATIKELEDI